MKTKLTLKIYDTDSVQLIPVGNEVEMVTLREFL